MSNIYYLRNTINNLESWFEGFVDTMRTWVIEDAPPAYTQHIVLYDREISEIIAHARNLLNDIEGCESNEK